MLFDEALASSIRRRLRSRPAVGRRGDRAQLDLPMISGASERCSSQWYSMPRGRSGSEPLELPYLSPRYSVTTSETDPPRSPASPSTFFAFAATPPPLRLTLGPVLVFAKQLPSF